MKSTIEFLDAVKTAHGLTSDYQLSKFLGVTHQSVSLSMAGKTFLGDETAIKVADALKIDPAIVLAAVHFERAKKAQEKEVWKGIFEKLGGLAAGVFLGVALFSLVGSAGYSTQAEASNSDLTSIYIIRSDRTPKLPVFLVIPLIPFFPRFLQYIRRR